MRVVIIGAGLGGLTLAHGLRGAGIEVAVHERGPRHGAQPASYGIHVDADGARALHACLPAANWAMFDAGTTAARDVIRFRDTTLDVLATIDRDTPRTVADPVAHRRAVRRDVLHGALLHGLDLDGPGAVVHHDRTFAAYAVEPDGRVTVRFADGTTDRADLLVGADGSNSGVRRQRLPDLERVDLGVLNVAGRIPVSEARRAGLPDGMLDSSMNMIVPSGPGWMFSSTWPAPAGPAAGGGGGYLVWAYAAARSGYPRDVGSHTGGQWRAVLDDRLAGWDPALRAVVAGTPPETIAPVVMRSMPRLPSWEPGPVTLLGDAVHTMTPMAGIGANTALRDADALRRALVDTAGDPIGAVGDYEGRMRAYANEALALSTRNAGNAGSRKRLPRLAFRTLLRVAETVPAVKRAAFATP